jgi:hypothetical protein
MPFNIAGWLRSHTGHAIAVTDAVRKTNIPEIIFFIIVPV